MCPPLHTPIVSTAYTYSVAVRTVYNKTVCLFEELRKETIPFILQTEGGARSLMIPRGVRQAA